MPHQNQKHKQKQKRLSNYSAGLLAEFIAKIYLRLKGYRILKQRFIIASGKGSKYGEIDLIVKRGRTVVFIEVKKRSTISLAAESIFFKQQQRIIHTAQAFIAINSKYQDYNLRFDVILFNKSFRFTHILNAFIS